MIFQIAAATWAGLLNHMRIFILLLTAVVFGTGCSEKHFRHAATSAMVPTIQPNEDIVVDMSAFWKNPPQRWDVVLFHPAQAPEAVWAMRVIGLPMETLDIREDGVYINGERQTEPASLVGIHYSATLSNSPQPMVQFPYKIASDCYFLVGDNTTNSFDSRFWGALPKGNILGRVKNK